MTKVYEGVYPDLSFGEYRSAPGIGQSMLKAFDAEPTPAHFLESLTRPKEATEDMEFGTILHAAILTPELPKAYHVRPKEYPTKEGPKPWDGRATYCKDWKKDHADMPCIDFAQEEAIPKIVDRVMSLPVAGDMLRAGQKEVSFFKRDEETGLMLKCRVDCIATDTDGTTHLLDLKKVRRAYAAESRFGVQCADLGYDIQAASYIHITGASRFIFVPMEDMAPFEAEMFELDSEDIVEGFVKWRRMLRAYYNATADGTWPGYSRTVKRLKLPAWAKDKARREAEVIYL